MWTIGFGPIFAGVFRLTDTGARYGLLLPHFGVGAEVSQTLDFARRAEALGFDSLWVRDRLVAGAPHGLLLEAGGTALFEPLLTLAAVAAVTSRITLGTAVLLPNRHPLRLAQQVGTLTQFAPNRIILGLGLGVGSLNFESLGLGYESRVELLDETVEALKGWAQGRAYHQAGARFSSEDIEIDPPVPADLPIYYGGVSRAAVRRAFEFADGWIAGRLPRDTFRSRMQLVARYRAETGRRLDIVTMPITLVDAGGARHADTAREAVALLAGSAEGASDWIKPPSGHFETVEDLSGLLITGDPERCTIEVRSILESGATHIVFDLRLAFDDLASQIELLASEVIPLVDC